MKALHTTQGITPFLTTDYDLLYLIRKTTQALPITILGQWVKARYTGKNRELQHDLNNTADDLATTHLDTPPTAFTPHRLPLAPPGYRIRVLCDNSIITSKCYNMLAKLKHDNSLQDYIMKKTNWTLQQFEQVNWDAHQQAFHRQTQHQKI
jgi:hypothetical protein